MFNLFIKQTNNVWRKTSIGLVSIVLPIILLLYWLFIQERSFLMWTEARCVEAFFYVVGGLILAFLLFSGRLRFWLPTGILLMIQWVVQGILALSIPGEFNFFNWYAAWIIHSTLFCLGWLMGWCLQRFRLGVYGFLLFFLFLVLHSLTLQVGYTANTFLRKIVPFIWGVSSCVFMYELWHRYNYSTRFFLLRYWGRCLLGIVLLGFVFTLLSRFFYYDIEVRLMEYVHKKQSSEQLEKNHDGTFMNKKNMGLGAFNKRSNNPNPLFCAHIKLNFPGTDIPNPLYMVSYHFNRFDTLTETFERDTVSQYADEFVPSPVNYSFFQTYTDSTIFLWFDHLKSTQVVETDVYTMQLSNDFFVAPSTAFSVQPFPVDAPFRTQYRSAYKALSRVSLLNSAYWVYNARDPMLQAFQEQRFDILQTADRLRALPANFYQYYTQFPSGGIYKPIKQLADSLQKGKRSQLDKVLAIRDYFLQRDLDGSPMYQYADNPGIPGLPGASRLLYFLFESKRGYCAYYAASTVALLRLMGIPARVVTGFMTVDRSDKNRGWYWFYEDQAHAWVQVYFQGYGWMDFDTTIGDNEAQESPKPDATPPSAPREAWLVLKGDILQLDSIEKTLLIHVQHAVIQNTEFNTLNDTLLLNVSKQVFWSDSVQLTWRDLRTGQRISAISYSELDRLGTAGNDWSKHKLVWTNPIPIDEVFLMPSPVPTPAIIEHNRELVYFKWYNTVFFVLLFILLLIFLLPKLSYYYYSWQVKRSHKSLYPSYCKLMYLLHMAGYSPKEHSVGYFAHHCIDPAFQVDWTAWLAIYWKEKYAGTALDDTIVAKAKEEATNIEKKIIAQLSLSTRRWMWFSLNRYFRFWENKALFKA